MNHTEATATTTSEAANAPVTSSSKRVTEMPANWGEPDITINMGTKPGLKFNPEQFQVRAGSKVKVVFSNEDDMLHNFVVVLPGTAIQVGEMAMKLGLKASKKIISLKQKRYCFIPIFYNQIRQKPYTS
jgi:uncharacterized cupredoxin-like copper-binding protein